MNHANLVVLLCSIYTSLAQDCKYTRPTVRHKTPRIARFHSSLVSMCRHVFGAALIRICLLFYKFETNAEAERRAVFERCLLNCSESARGLNPCYNCIRPYENYGCLLKREELIGCENDCTLQNSEEDFMFCLRLCDRKRRTLKKLRNFKLLSDRERSTRD